MTAPRQVLFNTLEQILSADLIRIGALAGKAAMDSILYTHQGIQGTTPRDITLDGLNMTAGVGLSVDLAAGSLARFNAAAGADASKYDLIRLDSSTNVPLGAADPTNPRVDTIYLTPTSTDTDSQSRNVLTLPARVVTPTLVFKTRDASATVSVAAGTPAASPTVPAAPAGSVAVWLVFVPASAVSLTSAELADCRVEYNTFALTQLNERLNGFHLSRSNFSNSSLTISAGAALIDGGMNQPFQAKNISGLDASPDGTVALAADTEYDCYLVGRNSGTPVGNTIADSFIPVLVSGNAPDERARPSALLTYRPWQGIHDEVLITTQSALWIGSLRTLPGAATFEPGGSGIVTARSGREKDANLEDQFLGIATNPHSWVRKPNMAYASATTVTISPCQFIMAGIYMAVETTTVFSMATDLIDAENPSTWYYCYLRRRHPKAFGDRTISRSVIPIISSEAPDSFGKKPTPEATFASDDYIFCGSLYNNSSSDVERFVRDGDVFMFTLAGTAGLRIHDISTAIVASPSKTSMTQIIPKTSRLGMVNFALGDVGGTGSVALQVFHGTGEASPAYIAPRYNVTSFTGGALNFKVRVDASEDFEANLDTAATILRADVYQLGFIEDLSGDLAP